MNNYIQKLKNKPIKTNNKFSDVPQINLDFWREFRFGNLINEPYKGYAYTKENLDNYLALDEDDVSIPYITRTAENNGCEMKTSADELKNIEEGNAITIGDTTATLFYQKKRFITGDHMVIIRADWLNEKTALFILSVLAKEKYKYSYGRAFIIDKIKDTILLLPIVYKENGKPKIDNERKYSSEGFIPDWDFMEKYISSLPYGDRI